VAIHSCLSRRKLQMTQGVPPHTHASRCLPMLLTWRACNTTHHTWLRTEPPRHAGMQVLGCQHQLPVREQRPPTAQECLWSRRALASTRLIAMLCGDV
jgi:hypothetical protein